MAFAFLKITHAELGSACVKCAPIKNGANYMVHPRFLLQISTRLPKTLHICAGRFFLPSGKLFIYTFKLLTRQQKHSMIAVEM